MARPKPFTHNAALDRQRRDQLVDAGMERYAPSARTIGYTANLRDSANALVDTAPARYVRMNNYVHVWFDFANPQGGAGNWRMELPFQPSTVAVGNAVPLGQWLASRSTAPTAMDGWIEFGLDAPFGYRAFFATRNTAGIATPSYVTAAYPWNWAAAPGIPVWHLGGSFAYEAADGYTP